MSRPGANMSRPGAASSGGGGITLRRGAPPSSAALVSGRASTAFGHHPPVAATSPPSTSRTGPPLPQDTASGPDAALSRHSAPSKAIPSCKQRGICSAAEALQAVDGDHGMKRAADTCHFGSEEEREGGKPESASVQGEMSPVVADSEGQVLEPNGHTCSSLQEEAERSLAEALEAAAQKFDQEEATVVDAGTKGSKVQYYFAHSKLWDALHRKHSVNAGQKQGLGGGHDNRSCLEGGRSSLKGLNSSLPGSSQHAKTGNLSKPSGSSSTGSSTTAELTAPAFSTETDFEVLEPSPPGECATSRGKKCPEAAVLPSSNSGLSRDLEDLRRHGQDISGSTIAHDSAHEGLIPNGLHSPTSSPERGAILAKGTAPVWQGQLPGTRVGSTPPVLSASATKAKGSLQRAGVPPGGHVHNKEAAKRQERRRRHKAAVDEARKDPSRMSLELLRCRRPEGQAAARINSLLSWSSSDTEMLHSITSGAKDPARDPWAVENAQHDS